MRLPHIPESRAHLNGILSLVTVRLSPESDLIGTSSSCSNLALASAERLALSCVVLRERSDRWPRQLQCPSSAAAAGPRKARLNHPGVSLVQEF